MSTSYKNTGYISNNILAGLMNTMAPIARDKSRELHQSLPANGNIFDTKMGMFQDNTLDKTLTSAPHKTSLDLSLAMKFNKNTDMTVSTTRDKTKYAFTTNTSVTAAEKTALATSTPAPSYTTDGKVIYPAFRRYTP